ncbi:hypothetical protein YWY31_57430 [Paenibacillus illinoisensis]|uniref:hypothetical protein n=1 Tax=Paenibacillus illinoisensis TaxID=59845 RepID=UPI0034B4FE82
MNVKLIRSALLFGGVPLAILGWMLILGLGATHVYAEDQSSADKQSTRLSLDLLSRDADDTLNLTPSVSVSTPILDIEVPSIQANKSTSKLSVSELKVDTPLGSAETSEIGLNAKQGKVELPSVQADTSVLKANVSGSELDLNAGTASLPGVAAEVPEVIKAETSAVKTDLRQGKVELPSVKVDVPEVTSVDVSSAQVDLTQGKVQLPSVKTDVPALDVSAEMNPGKGSLDIPVLKPAEPSVTPEQPVSTPKDTSVVTDSNGEGVTMEKAASVDSDSSQDNEGQSTTQTTGQVIHDTTTLTEQEQPVVQQASPVEKSKLEPNSDGKVVRMENDPIQVDQLSTAASVTDQVQDRNHPDVIVQKNASDHRSPLQPSAERPTTWSVMATSTVPGATNASASGSSGSSALIGNGAAAPAAVLPGATNGLAGSDSGFAFRIESVDGFSQWSQAPPGRPPQYTSFSQLQWR